MAKQRLGIVSDIHYACAAEKARGTDYEFRGIPNPLLRSALRVYRRLVWLRHPLEQGQLLRQFLDQPAPLDLVVANGDFSCDSAFIGITDDAAFASAKECLETLRARFGSKLKAVIGDHELGKFSFVGRQGGMRLRSFQRATEQLGIEPVWTVELGRYTLLGFTSSLLALPNAREEILPEEQPSWESLRAEHIRALNELFLSVDPNRRLILFCHDPTALPFLWRETAVSKVLPQVEQTFIGHLHSRTIFGLSRWLRGMPELRFLGHTARKLSSALREAQYWKPFRVRLCPSLAGIELFKDGGFYTVELDTDARCPAKFHLHKITR